VATEELSMIGYTTLGTNNMDRAAKFYDALLGEFGAKRAMETDRLILWATARARRCCR
jgi:catechol 2,3-dioxygenase-like lactoylglutathione lyase family enzyme